MRFRQLIAFTIVLVIGNARAQTLQNLDQKVSIEFRAGSVARLLAELSQKTQVPMVAAGKMEFEIVALRVADVKLSDLLTRLANVTGGAWDTTGGVYRLTYDDAKLKALDRAKQQREAKKIQARIKAMVGKHDLSRIWTALDADKVIKDIQTVSQDLNKSAEGTDTSASYERYAQLTNANPTGRLTLKLLSLMDPMAIASVEPNKRVVFSSSPNRMQRPMPGAERAIQEFLIEQGVWSGSVAQLPKATNDEEYVDSGSGYMMNSAPIKTQIAKVLLVVTNFSSFAGFNTELKVIDVKGNIVATTSMGLNDEDLEDSNLFDPEGDPNDKTPEIRLSEASKALTKVVTPSEIEGAQPNRGLNSIPPEFKNMFLNPDSFDPLSFVLTDALFSVAETKKLNLVASIPDTAFYLSFFLGMQPNAKEGRFLETVKLMGDFAISEADPGWLTASPDDGWRSRLNRTERAPLSMFLKSLDQSGYSLDAYANYLAKSPTSGDGFESLGNLLIYTLFPEIAMMGEAYDTQIIRFYGLLTADQKINLAKGRPLTVATLMPSQRAQLHRMIFDRVDGGGFQSVAVDTPALTSDTFAPPEEGISYNTEVTEQLPNGLPPNGLIKMDLVRELVAAMVNEKGPSYGNYMYGAEDLGNALATEERPDLFPWVNEGPKLSQGKFRIANRTRYTFHFLLVEGMTDDRQLTDTRTSTDPPVGVGQLPDPFRKAMEAAKKKALAEYKNMKPGDFDVPPPDQIPPRKL